jgi:hypothetical protein
MRSTGRRSLSIGLLVAVGALLVCVASAGAATIPIKGGEVDWGIKESFRNYIKGGAAGEIEVSGGAVEAADGTFKFPVGAGSYDTKTHLTEVEATGTVHFTGHAGALDMTFSDPRVVLGTESGALFADVHSKSLTPGGAEDFPGVEFATLDTSGVAPVFGAESVRLDAIPTTLTAAGAEAFAGFYSAGAALDPLGVTAAFEPTPPPVEEPKEEPKKPVDEPRKPADGAPSTSVPSPEAPTVAPATPKKPVGLRGVRKLSATGVATVARLTCPRGGATCAVTVPKILGVKIAGKRYALGVMAPRKIGAGKSSTVRVHVSKAAREALGAKKRLIKVSIALHANGQTAKQVVKVKIAGRH